MPGPTPTNSGIALRRGDFATLTDALEYAAQGETGLDFYNVRGELTHALGYRDLRDDALALARRLLARGLARGERVALVAETHPDFVRAFFACQYAGLVPAPLPLPTAFGGRDSYLAHVTRLIGEAGAVAILAPAAMVEWLEPVAAQRGLRLCCSVADLAETEASFQDLLPSRPGDVAYLQFSSGSTRFPIGIVVRQRALMANIGAILQHGLQARELDRAVSWLPFYHDMGLVGFLLTPIAGQITVDLLATQDFARRPLLWLSLISSRRATVSYSPSFGFDLCTRRQQQVTQLAAGQGGAGQSGAALDLSCWRIAGVGGDMIRPAVLEGFAAAFAGSGFRQQAFLPSYGMAEATLAISFGTLDRGIETDTLDLARLEQGVAIAPQGPDARSRTVVLCGAPLPLHAVQVRDEFGTVLPNRRVGRIFARGPSLMLGYDGRPAETDAVLSADGWLDTGDLGYRLGDNLVITGRAKDLIIINGRNIWPQDLEWTVEQAIREIRTGNVAAFSVEEDGREVLILAAEARMVAGTEARQTLTAAIRDTVRVQHGLDSRVMLLAPNTLPYTSSGKLSRSGVRQRYLAGTLAAMAVPA